MNPRKNSPSLIGRILRFLLSFRYKIRVVGDIHIHEHSKKGTGIIFAPNHPALVDPLIVYSIISGYKPRPMSDAERLRGFLGRLVKIVVNPVVIGDLSKRSDRAALDSINKGLTKVSETLKNGDNVLFYPAGQIYRGNKESIGAKSGLYRILKDAPEANIILIRTSGLWGSTASFAGAGGNPDFLKFLLKGIVTVIGNLLFLTPRREVFVEFIPAALSSAKNGNTAERDDHEIEEAYCNDIPKKDKLVELPTGRKSMNMALETFYNTPTYLPLFVPRFFWSFCKQSYFIYKPKVVAIVDKDAEASVTNQIREMVYAVIHEEAGLASDFEILPSMTLNNDLGLDSLSLMNVAIKIEEGVGHPLASMEKLVQVNDLLLAAAGLLDDEDAQVQGLSKKISKVWNQLPKARELKIPADALNIAEAFLHHTKFSPNEPVAADINTIISRRKAWIIALLLLKKLETIPDKRVGVLLPATPMITPLWLALMLAGKETVFLNWTVGRKNLEHCIENAGVKTVLTSSVLMDRLFLTMPELEGIQKNVAFIPLEKLSKSFSLLDKIKASIKGYTIKSCKAYPIKEIATVLFTSGTENLPKGVPLSHSNLLSDAEGVFEALNFKPDISILAMLPPFHSFGLMADCVVPMALGVRAAFHSNPTEAGKLNKVIRDFGVTLIAAAPTFLASMLDKAESDMHSTSSGLGLKHGKGDELGVDARISDLADVQFAFVGAEKCQQNLIDSFKRLCPKASLCEGYGITECSPIISLNRPWNTRFGTVGQPLPKVICHVVKEENGSIIRSAKPRETGMLLVRGPNVFSGYLSSKIEDSASQTSPFVEYEGESWYRSGDLVSMDEEGFITFQGRLKRFVKIGGEMISLPQIETILLEHVASIDAELEAHINQGDEVQTPQGPLIAVEALEDKSGVAQPEIILFATYEITVQEANRVLKDAGLSPLSSVRRVVMVPEIPLLGTGKTDYRALKKIAESL